MGKFLKICQFSDILAFQSVGKLVNLEVFKMQKVELFRGCAPAPLGGLQPQTPN